MLDPYAIAISYEAVPKEYAARGTVANFNRQFMKTEFRIVLAKELLGTLNQITQSQAKMQKAWSGEVECALEKPRP